MTFVQKHDLQVIAIFHQNSMDIASLPSVISCYERKFNIELIYDFLVGNLFIILPLIMNTEKAMAPHSSTLAWKIPWTEEPGGLQSVESIRVGYD